jgi:hypothetical protein
VSAQAKAISEVVKDFEQSLENYRPPQDGSTWQVPERPSEPLAWSSGRATLRNEILASIGKSPIEKRARISPLLDFLDGGRSKESVSDEERAALQNWVIQTIAKQIHFVKNPSITSRRDTALIAAICAAPAKGTPRNWPRYCLKIEGREVLLWDASIDEPCFAISLLLARLAKSGWPVYGRILEPA